MAETNEIPLKICVLFLVVALLAAPTVSAKKTNEYTIRPSIGNASEITISVTDSIRQGETKQTFVFSWKWY